MALTAAVPYVALQFKAVAMSVEVLADVPSDAGLLADPAFYVALLLAVFAILFGTRQIDATEHHRGMVLAVALESLVKLLAFLAIGVFALMHLPGVGYAAGAHGAGRATSSPRPACRPASSPRPCSPSPRSSACRASSTSRWSNARTRPTCARRAGCSAATWC